MLLLFPAFYLLFQYAVVGQLLRSSNCSALAERYYRTAYKMRAYYHDDDSPEMVAFLKELFSFFLSSSKFVLAKYFARKIDAVADSKLSAEVTDEGINLKYEAALRLSSVEHHLAEDYSMSKHHLKQMIHLLKINKNPTNKEHYELKIRTLKSEILELKKSRHVWWKVWKR